MVQYLDDHFKLGRWLGMSTDVGPAIFAKIIEENGRVPYRSTYQALTQDEWEQDKCKAEH